MKLSKKAISLIFATTFLSLSSLFLTSAKAIDIPVLTWEKGKEQSIELAGYPGKTSWDIELVTGVTTIKLKPLKFQQSFSNGKNYFYYSIYLPQSLPNGNYEITAGGNGLSPSVVAAVKVVNLNYYQITEIPVDLLVILGFYVFLTAALSVLRIRRYDTIFYLSRTENDSTDKLGDESEDAWPPVANTSAQKLTFANRYRKFLEGITDNLQASLFKTILIKDRAQLEVLSPKFWSLFPPIAVLLGILGSIEQLHLGGIAAAPIWIYFVFTLLALIDIFSGILAFAAFFLVQLFFGHPKSFREVLAMAVIIFAVVGPAALFASLTSLMEVKENSGEDESKQRKVFSSFLPGNYVAAIAAGLLFYIGIILALSLKIDVTGTTGVALVYPSALVLLILAKDTIFKQALAAASNELTAQNECFAQKVRIGRVVSPTTTLILFIGITTIFYTWLESWSSSLLIGTLLTLPYALLFIQVTDIKAPFLLRIKRNWIVEGVITLLVAGLAFYLVEKLPLNTLQRSHLFVFLSLIPLLLHSIFSALWDGNERRKEYELGESNQQNFIDNMTSETGIVSKAGFASETNLVVEETNKKTGKRKSKTKEEA